MNFLVNGIERRLGFDLNGDGYIGGQGFLSRLERFTHIDFNGDNIIGRPPDVLYGYQGMYPSGYGGYPSMGYYGHSHHHYGPHMHHFGYTY